MRVTRTKTASGFAIETHAKLTFSIFVVGTVNYSASSRSEYENGVLQEYEMNGKVRDKTPFSSIKKVANGYKLHMQARNVDVDDIYPNKITATFLRLYFEEPHGVVEIFSENTGELAEISPQGGGEYATEINGNDWVLRYRNGKLVEAEFDGMVDYTLVLDQPEPNRHSD